VKGQSYKKESQDVEITQYPWIANPIHYIIPGKEKHNSHEDDEANHPPEPYPEQLFSLDNPTTSMPEYEMMSSLM
jgi:hypothetical protein